MAIAAVDVALWDLKARLLGCRCARLLGAGARRVPVYGSRRVHLLLASSGWPSSSAAGSSSGIPRVKMKVGRDPGGRSRARARRARGDRRRHASCSSTPTAPTRASRRSRWPSASRRGRRELVRGARVAPTISTGCAWCATARPAGWTSPPASTATTRPTSARMLEAGAVDVLQADATRCAGITGFLRVDGAVRARTACRCRRTARRRIHLHPALRARAARPSRVLPRPRAHRAPALRRRRRAPRGGALYPDLDRPGNGLELKRDEAERYAA